MRCDRWCLHFPLLSNTAKGNKTPPATLVKAKKDNSRGFGKSIRVTWQQSAEVLANIRAQNLTLGTPVFLISQEADEPLLVVGAFG
ncbi:unnamed protein product [Penicillium camemberti]|uniref:Str. FM013 n=1 Tax=Penicillium camemberti (strain FM 013) TaxID=1429867 RepID=A0A0G4P5P2_PENC3|nr:unnamed protein product [Penicillium camemberti]